MFVSIDCICTHMNVCERVHRIIHKLLVIWFLSKCEWERRTKWKTISCQNKKKKKKHNTTLLLFMLLTHTRSHVPEYETQCTLAAYCNWNDSKEEIINKTEKHNNTIINDQQTHCLPCTRKWWKMWLCVCVCVSVFDRQSARNIVVVTHNNNKKKKESCIVSK